MDYPKILFILFDINYEILHNCKSLILNLVEDNIIINFNVEYKQPGIIVFPSFNNYNIIIFYPLDCNIYKSFSTNYFYYNDGTSNNGNLKLLNNFENWKVIVIKYIVIYKFKEYN